MSFNAPVLSNDWYITPLACQLVCQPKIPRLIDSMLSLSFSYTYKTSEDMHVLNCFVTHSLSDFLPHYSSACNAGTGKMVFFNLANPCNSEWGGQPTPQPLFCAWLPPSPPSNSYLWCTKSNPLPQNPLSATAMHKQVLIMFMCAKGGCARSCLQQSGVAALIVTPKWPQIKNKWDVMRILSDWCLLTNIND